MIASGTPGRAKSLGCRSASRGSSAGCGSCPSNAARTSPMASGSRTSCALGERTHLQLAGTPRIFSSARPRPRYAYIVVDEAQNLHPAGVAGAPSGRPRRAQRPVHRWRRAPAHQRIYNHRASLPSAGINVHGRSRRLRLNYRTTYEILRWALGPLTGERFDDLDKGTDTLGRLPLPAPRSRASPCRAYQSQGQARRAGGSRRFMAGRACSVGAISGSLPEPQALYPRCG